MNGRPRSPRGQGEQLRAEVLAAVNRLLDEWGSDEKLTIRAVAKEVGVAPPSIYLHFTDKTDLVWAALSDKYEQLAESMRAAGEAAGPGDPRSRLLAQVDAYCRFALDNPGHYRLMYEVRQPSVDPARLGLHPARLVARMFRDAVNRCLAAGYPLSLPPLQTAHTLWAGLHGIVSLQHSLSLASARDVVAGLAGGLVDVLVGREPAAGASTPAETGIERLISGIIIDGH
jgi:AcrR family transcriptional regulator